MENEIKVGDIVTLKSGGVQMTVTHIDIYMDLKDVKQATCVWFNYQTQQTEKILIPVAGLKLYESTPSIVSEPRRPRNTY